MLLIADIQLYDVVAFVHVTSVVVGFGITLIYPVFDSIGRRSTMRDLLFFHRAQARIGATMIIPSLLVTAATGIYLAADRWEFSDFFVQWGFGIVVLFLALGALFLTPNEKRSAEIAGRHLDASEPPPEYLAVARRVARVGGLTLLLTILTVYFMTAKPFA